MLQGTPVHGHQKVQKNHKPPRPFPLLQGLARNLYRFTPARLARLCCACFTTADSLDDIPTGTGRGLLAALLLVLPAPLLADAVVVTEYWVKAETANAAGLQISSELLSLAINVAGRP
jgi:hypothetical protein